MGLELLPKVGNGALLSSYLHHFSETVVTFEFAYPVYQWVVGIWGFSLVHSDNHSATVETMSLELSSSKQGKIVTVNLDATLTDGHGHELDPEASWVIPVCLAVTDDTATGAYLQTVEKTIADGDAMQVLMADQGPYAYAQSVLGGFSLNYEKNNSVLGLSAGCDLTYDQGTGYIGASASMYDAHTHRAQDASVYAGCIAMDDSLGLTVTRIDAEQSFTPVKVPVSGAFSQAAVMLTNFKVRYQGHDDHWVSRVGAWAIGEFVLNDTPITFDSEGVTLPALAALVGDDTNHFQDQTLSNVSALLLTL